MGDDEIDSKAHILHGKKQRWYLGGVAGAGAVLVTHPLDLIKVHLQTQTSKNGVVKVIKRNLLKNGITSFYNGLSASLTRQLTYSTARFGVYDILQNRHKERGEVISFRKRLLYAGIGGVAGAFVGNFADVVNVRMQADVRIAPELRYNYKHVLDGTLTICRTEGVSVLFRGVEANCGRAALMNIGQVAFYDQIKDILLTKEIVKDDMPGHFVCSFAAGTGATIITQPVDVIKTRLMQSSKYSNIGQCILATAKEGPLAFFKGFVPAWIRLSPQTILTWMILERLRIIFPAK